MTPNFGQGACQRDALVAFMGRFRVRQVLSLVSHDAAKTPLG